MTCNRDRAFWHWTVCFSPKFLRFHCDLHKYKAVPDAAKWPQNISKPPPCFIVDVVFFSFFYSKKLQLGHYARNTVACGHAICEYFSKFQCVFSVFLSTVESSKSLRKWLWWGTDVPCLGLSLGSLSTIHTVLLFNMRLIFPLQPGKLTIVPWTLKFLISSIVTGTSNTL